tara:strand:- start:5431 stop:6072 length:642 start_codon:yes stop_codon:yes gene_type:complete
MKSEIGEGNSKVMNDDINLFLEKSLKSLIETSQLENLQLICPDEILLTEFIRNLTDVYNDCREYILEVNMLNIQSELNVINNILSFSSIKTLTTNFNLPKLIIIYQFSEIFSETFINNLEECIHNDNVKIIILSTTIHNISQLIQSKLITLHLRPTYRIFQNQKEHENDIFFKYIESDKDDNELSEFIQKWSVIHSKKIPHKIFKNIYDSLVV